MIADLKPYADYKKSGLPWLGQVPEHWSQERAKWLFTKMERPVGDDDGVVTCFRDGMVTLRKHRRLRGFTEAIYEFGYQGIRKGDLVIHAMDAFAGAVGVSDSDGKATPVYAVCQPKPGVNPHYYAFIVREMARSQWILALSRGIRERSTDFRYDTFGGQRVPLPPVTEQMAIVRFLDWATGRLERAIRAKRKVIALLNEQKKAIIHRAITRGLDPLVALKPSDIAWLGDIPKHWELRRIKQTSSILRGKFTHRPRNDASLYDGPYPFIQTGAVARAKKFITSYKQTLNAKGLAVSKLFPNGTLVMTIAANIGDVAILTFDACFPDSVVGFLPFKAIDRDYLYLVFLCMKPEFLREAPVNTQGNLNVERIGAMCAPCPPLEEQRRIVNYVSENTGAFDSAVAQTEREIDLLHEYRTRLVADVVTGKLDVREAATRLPGEATTLDTSQNDADLSDENEPADEEAVV